MKAKKNKKKKPHKMIQIHSTDAASEIKKTFKIKKMHIRNQKQLLPFTA